MAHVAGFAIGAYIFTIDGFGQDTGTGGFTHAPRTAKQEGMRQLLVLNGIFQGGGNMSLAHYGIKSLWSVFSG